MVTMALTQPLHHQERAPIQIPTQKKTGEVLR
jgi:hypothetical protein